MKILVLGSGLMGPAAAFNALSDPQVSEVCLCDLSAAQLELARRKLAGKPGADKLTTAMLDLNDKAATVRLMAGFDAILAALSKQTIPAATRAAIAAKKPLVDLSQPLDADAPGLIAEVKAAGALVIPGCGVEPGLTEIMARYLAEKLDRVDELHIQCGGIPEKPAPPLGYKIVFGGRQMPLRDFDGHTVEDGKLQKVTRYSGVEPTTYAGVGELEAWHENFMPWLLDLDAFKGLKTGTQKTVRWPGYAAKVTTLRELGLLSEKPIDVDGVQVAPKKLLDAVLYPARPAGRGRARYHRLPRGGHRREGRPAAALQDRHGGSLRSGARLHLDGAHDRLHGRHRRAHDRQRRSEGERLGDARTRDHRRAVHQARQRAGGCRVSFSR